MMRILLILFTIVALPAFAEDEIALAAAPRELQLGEIFSEATLSVFGTAAEEGDVAVVMEGPESDYGLTRRERKGPLWVAGKSIVVKKVPAFYAVVSSLPLQTMVEDGKRHELRLMAEDTLQELTGEGKKEFADAFLRLKAKNKLYAFNENGVNKLPHNGFRADILIPSNIPVGDYKIHAYLFRDRSLVGSAEIPYTIRKMGLSLALSDFTAHHTILSAFFAVGLMLSLGLVGSFLLPRR
jgi:uncharacterized protein (TIGR02186 family)